jgi:hypothetical protein
LKKREKNLAGREYLIYKFIISWWLHPSDQNDIPGRSKSLSFGANLSDGLAADESRETLEL